MLLDLSKLDDSPYNRILATVLHSSEKAETNGAFNLFIKAYKYTEEEYYNALICSVLQELHIHLYILKILKLETQEAIYHYLSDNKDPLQLPKPDMRITLTPSPEMQEEDCNIVIMYEHMPMIDRCKHVRERLLAYMQLTGHQEYVKYQTQRFFASLSLDQPYDKETINSAVNGILKTKEMAAKETSTDVLVQKVLRQLQVYSIPASDKMS